MHLNLTALFFITLSTMTACGSYQEIHNKNYLLYVNAEDVSSQAEIQRLINSFNARTGLEVLKTVANSNEANSSLNIKDIYDSDKKIGYGQWQTSSKSNVEANRILGKDMTRRVEYSMNIDLDKVFFMERKGLEASDPEYQRLQVLFYHEVGHGLQMRHDKNKSSIMFPIIKDASSYSYEPFFERVRSFFE